MVEEIGGLGEWSESVSHWENVSEVKEADIVRVQASLKSAKKLRWQIRSQSVEDGRYALLLTKIFQLLDDERLLVAVYQQLVEYHLPPWVLCTQFLPFLMERVDMNPWRDLFPHWRSLAQDVERTVSWIIEYLSTLWKDSPALQALPGDVYVRFVYYYLHGTGVVDLHSWDATKKEALLDTLSWYFLVKDT
jgi:hypothetical protein